jgi:hypothetical protein
LSAFPEEYKSLVPKVLVETMSELSSSFVSRVNVATGDVVPETRLVAKGSAKSAHYCHVNVYCHNLFQYYIPLLYFDYLLVVCYVVTLTVS